MKKILKTNKTEVKTETKTPVKPLAVQLKEVKRLLKNERIRSASYKNTKAELEQALNVANNYIVRRKTEIRQLQDAVAYNLESLGFEKSKSIWTLIKEGRKWF